MTVSELMLPEFDDETRRTRAVLAAVPADKLNWQATDGLRTIGWNANHLVEIISWTTDILDNDEFDIDPPGGPKYETPSIADPAQLLAMFDENVASARLAISGASDELLGQPWTMKMGGQVLFTMPKGACLRTWVFNHSVHHRGILSTYLRMAGVALTPVYDG